MPLPPATGQQFGRYALGRLLGHGGMGVVHAATDTVLQREVALKLIAAHIAEDPEFRARFAREATLLARLDSPHTVAIYDHGEHDGVLYIATQLIDGGDLTALVRERGPLPGADAVDLVGQVLAGLTDAHDAGITHRDVKPGNVLLRRRADRLTAYLCDFGIATTAGAQVTRTGGISGSLVWMAPERHAGRDAGAAGDVYSAGCLLWFLLTGAAPYHGTDLEIALGHLHGPVAQLPAADPFSTKINQVLARAMAKDPAARYPDAAAMRADLVALGALAPAGPVDAGDVTSIRQAVPLSAETIVPGGAAEPERRRRRRGALVLAAALTLALGGGLGLWALLGTHDGPAQGTTDDPTLAALASPSPLVTATPGGTKGRGGTAAHHGRTGDGLPAGPDTAAEQSAGSSTGTGAGTGAGTGTHTGTHLGTGGGNSPVPRPSGSPTPTAAPRAAYSCWNGTKVAQLSSCGWPKGYTGARWMVSDLPSCYTAHSSSSLIVESYGCNYATGSRIYVIRANSVADARQYLLSSISVNRVTGTWSGGGSAEGKGPSGSSLPPYRWGRYWNSSSGPWLMMVFSKTVAGRSQGINRFHDECRPLAEIQGRAI